MMHDVGISILAIFFSWLVISIIYGKNYWDSEPVISIVLYLSLTVLCGLLIALFSKIDPNEFILMGVLAVFSQAVIFFLISIHRIKKQAGCGEGDNASTD